jgi:hypothetical protein
MGNAMDWRDRATECERLAQEATDPTAKQSYLDLAKTWRDLADKLNRRDATIPRRNSN